MKRISLDGKPPIRRGVATHGKSGSREYSSWNGMRHRCLNVRYRDYFRYGARGITVCDRWLSFENFLEDMGAAPGGYSLDRIDNNRGYFPENCRWANKTTQQRNRKNTVFITLENETRTLVEWCSHFQRSYSRAYHAIVTQGRNPLEFLCPKS